MKNKVQVNFLIFIFAMIFRINLATAEQKLPQMPLPKSNLEFADLKLSYPLCGKYDEVRIYDQPIIGTPNENYSIGFCLTVSGGLDWTDIKRFKILSFKDDFIQIEFHPSKDEKSSPDDGSQVNDENEKENQAPKSWKGWVLKNEITTPFTVRTETKEYALSITSVESVSLFEKIIFVRGSSNLCGINNNVKVQTTKFLPAGSYCSHGKECEREMKFTIELDNSDEPKVREYIKFDSSRACMT